MTIKDALRGLVLVVGLLTVAAAEAPRVSIRVTQAGEIECHVRRDPWNRRLEAGVLDMFVSARQLDGERAPVLWTFALPHSVCDGTVETAYCLVEYVGGKAQASANFICSN